MKNPLTELSLIAAFKRLTVLSFCLGIFVMSCATKPTVTPREALDYGQFVLRQLPPDVEVDALKEKRIVVDPGHGGVFRGAVGPNNLSEADVNLGVALYLWGMLKQAGAEVYLTRVDDTEAYEGDDLDLKKDLQARAEFAETHEADLFVSLHHNADVLPDKKKNSLETYFKMSDPGPSLDVTKCIHRQLALSLKQGDNAILPGNFHVLRENSATAVLGEPSYISHAENAFRLGLAPLQRIEAQAYFLGIAEYFSKGVPAIEIIQPLGVLNDNPKPVILGLAGTDRNVAIDPSSIVMLIDGEPVQPEFNPVSSQISYMPSERFANGKHSVKISLRNINGNAARAVRNEIEVAMPPAYLLLNSNFPRLRPGDETPVRLVARIYDIDLIPVADGTPVEFNASAGTVSPKVSLTQKGEAFSYFSLEGKEVDEKITISAITSGRSQSMEIDVNSNASEIIAIKILNDMANVPIENALVSKEGQPLGYSDRSGYFAATRQSIGDIPITFSQLGYRPQDLRLSERANVYTIKLEPIAGGVLHGQSFAIDPQFGGEEKGITGLTGTRASDLNLDTANHLAQFLRASGARVILTRESDVTVSPLRRVEIAEEFGAEWFISIGHGSAAPIGTMENEKISEDSFMETATKVLHYPTSPLGEKLAVSIAGMLSRRAIAEKVDIEPDTTFVLTHTSSPAVIVSAPAPSTFEMEEKLRHPHAARNEAYSIYCGILENFGLNKESTGEASVRILDNKGNAISNALVIFDGAFVLQTDSNGQSTFSRLTPGMHTLKIFSEQSLIWSGEIHVEAGHHVVVDISTSGPTVVSILDAI